MVDIWSKMSSIDDHQRCLQGEALGDGSRPVANGDDIPALGVSDSPRLGEVGADEDDAPPDEGEGEGEIEGAGDGALDVLALGVVAGDTGAGPTGGRSSGRVDAASTTPRPIMMVTTTANPPPAVAPIRRRRRARWPAAIMAPGVSPCGGGTALARISANPEVRSYSFTDLAPLRSDRWAAAHATAAAPARTGS